jgi:hypothetical protein
VIRKKTVKRDEAAEIKKKENKFRENRWGK